MRMTASGVQRGAAGFTLIEVMIAVLVVAILGAIAFPSYQDQVRKGKRAEGKAALLRAAQLQEREYTSNGSYTTELGRLFGVTGTVRSSEDNPGRGNYDLSVSGAPTGGLLQGYTLTATPNTDRDSGGGFVDPDCGVLTLSSTGVRTFTFSGDAKKSNKDRCW
jgi:type IV pilus assembly protein PilE